MAVELGEKLGVNEVDACARIIGMKSAEVRIFWEIFTVRHLANAGMLPKNYIKNTFYIDVSLYRGVLGETLAATFHQYPFTPRGKLFLGSMAARHVLPVLAGLISSELESGVRQDQNLGSWKAFN
ncbi:hypothetical protein GF391_00715 [Candidatus Uhrbacteria bacterium]|nr:hypothetical protein [Candidatus Uhrbacteria bacterium]